MPLYNQATNLQGRGNFAPGVTYYAGIKAPKAPDITLPKGQYSFNINLDSIGRAMSQMSRDKAALESDKFKFELQQKEKAEAAAEKQLKLDLSNAYAQELADVTAQVDQGLINPLEASRRVKTIDDRYRSYGVLGPSEMAPIRNNYDGGVSQYQEKTREQLRQSEIAFEEKLRQEVVEAVPSAIGESRDNQLKLWYDLNNADMQLADSVKIYNANPSTENASLLQSRADNLADWQARTVLSNALNNDNRYSTADMFNMVVGGVDRALSERGVTNPQMRAYAAQKAYNRYSKLAEAKAKFSDETLKAMKNENGIIDESFMYAMRTMDPMAWGQALAQKHGLSLFDKETLEARTIDKNEITGERMLKFGGYTTQGTGFSTDSEGNIKDIIERSVPTTWQSYLINSNLPIETKSMLLSFESLPTGPILDAGVNEVVAGSLSPNVTLPGSTLYNSSISTKDLTTAMENNKGYMDRTKNNTMTMQNIQKKDSVSGTNNAQILTNQDRSEIYNTWLGNPDVKAEADTIYIKDVLPFSNAGEYAALYNSLVVDDQNGVLSVLNNYQTSGFLENTAAKFTAYNAKQSVKNINAFAQRLFPEDANKRSKLIRSFFDGMNASIIPSYQYGMGGATLEPTSTESAAYYTLKGADKAAKYFRDVIYPAIETSYNKLENKVNTFTKEKFDSIKEDFKREKEVDPTLTPEQYVKNKALGLVQDLSQDMINNIDEASKNSSRELTVFDKVGNVLVKGLTDAVNWAVGNSDKETETTREWDLQRGTVDVRDPEQLPIHFDEDGNWSNMLYGTITADGRTFVVPGLDDEGNPSDNKTEFDKGRYFFSIKGDDKEAKEVAENLAAKVREYVINRDNPYNKKEEPILTEEIKSENTENRPLLERLNLLKFKNKDTKLTPAEKKIKENLDNYNTIADQIANLKDSSLEGFDEAVETVHDLGLDQGTALAAFMNITDDNGKDLWLEKLNELGEKSFAIPRQALFVISSVLPAIFVAGGKGAVKGAELIESFMGWLSTAKGVHVPTSKERKAQRKLINAIKNVKDNLELYSERYPENDFIDFPESLGLNSEPLEFRKPE